MPYTVNIIDIELALIELGGTAQAKDIQDWILANRCDAAIPGNYQSERSFRQTIQRKIEDHCPDAEGFDARKRAPKFRRIDRGIYRTIGKTFGDIQLAEELSSTLNYTEGSAKRIIVNSYERDNKARMACIAHYGAQCAVCSFNFEDVYGPIGKSYIHVHHLVPLHSIGVSYTVDPINDLRPVCPNCHAMLHQAEPPLEPDALGALIGERRRSRKLGA